ncbi:unnamed protein product [Linum tenue]|uniref:Uncharacterized protein n=1 Tax=Linum tenue TaxID=586396 RepID=A0AAV0S0W1_9ROSI|nr:unnamed protein product [Linum tenue]
MTTRRQRRHEKKGSRRRRSRISPATKMMAAGWLPYEWKRELGGADSSGIRRRCLASLEPSDWKLDLAKGRRGSLPAALCFAGDDNDKS